VYTFSDLEPRDADDFSRYERDGTGVNDDGATKGEPSDLQVTTYIWSFISNETELQLDGDTSKVLINDGTTLKIEGAAVGDLTFHGNDNTLIMTLTFMAQ